MQQPIAGFRRTAAAVFRAAADFVFPPVCPICGADVHPHQPEDSPRPTSLCRDCVEGLTPAPTDRCVRCSAPVGPYLDTSAGCIHCRDDAFAFERVYSLGVYHGLLQSAVLAAKRPGGEPLAHCLADLFWQREGRALEELPIDLVVPVPHHWTERLLRRQLPPVTLSRRLAVRLRVPWSGRVLMKVRRTRPQAGLSPSQRRRNLRGAFRVSRGAGLEDRAVLLVDDVLTTGTTAQRATRELRAAGAASVHVAVVARGLGEHGTT